MHGTQQLKTYAAKNPISLKDALAQDGMSFSGKKFKKKEIDLGALRRALGDSLVLQDVPMAPEPEMEAVARGPATQQAASAAPRGDARGKPLISGQKISL